MDRMLFLAMSGAKQTMIAQEINTNNLANVSTPAFKADLEQFRSMPVFGEGHPSRVYAMTESPGVDFTPGMINATGRDLDVAINGQGWIAVQAPDGNEAYTRMGNLNISSTGVLVTGNGHPVLGNGGAPITLPPVQKMEIGTDGTISIVPLGEDPNTVAILDRIKLVKPEHSNMTKGEDGFMRLKEGDEAEADATIRLELGKLEGSNVNPVASMVEMIELQRQYELQVKVMKKAEENDSALSKLMSMMS
ncbi:flagellar basal-body rod protein FlgF [Ectothiorhodospiraceae bacterium BW-2]|nr:flagellar basal-body rod protein FlgF [Ectothiorhodospiraceae bacterium BW-2]